MNSFKRLWRVEHLYYEKALVEATVLNVIILRRISFTLTIVWCGRKEMYGGKKTR